MTPDMKRLIEAAEDVFLPMRLDHLEGHEAEAVVRAVLAELRAPSEQMLNAASLRKYRYRHSTSEPSLTSEGVDAIAFAATIDHILGEPTAPR